MIMLRQATIRFLVYFEYNSSFFMCNDIGGELWKLISYN